MVNGVYLFGIFLIGIGFGCVIGFCYKRAFACFVAVCFEQVKGFAYAGNLCEIGRRKFGEVNVVEISETFNVFVFKFARTET